MAEDMTVADPDTDAAWVTVETPLTGSALLAFCREDVERLFRINSLSKFDEWRQVGPDEHHFRLRNLSNDRRLETGLRVEQLPDGLRVTYGDGLKTTTTFQVEETARGSWLKVTDDYSGTPVEERQQRTDEVDQSLTRWGHDLHRYLANWHRWSRYVPWRWYMTRFWQPMTPMARRVSYLVMVVTGLEFFAFLMVFAIFVLELDKYVGL